ncbi:hypothetical protein AZE42_13747 [Rhizopogon vesiculosus]|uniref:Uncharacterized protein n=1 Tax=Rhizopogon vesiculosus TaxID=180088 RepID=A0A1J8PIF1_9AGAM|nr:hypothetical protein AZE42_13747 [Rhizopogon vesiculosus]
MVIHQAQPLPPYIIQWHQLTLDMCWNKKAVDPNHHSDHGSIVPEHDESGVPSPSGTNVLGAVEIAKWKLREAIQHLQDDNGRPNPNLDNKRDALVECILKLERGLSSVPVQQDMVD